jgi:hypothetical protein
VALATELRLSLGISIIGREQSLRKRKVRRTMLPKKVRDPKAGIGHVGSIRVAISAGTEGN